MRPPTPANLWSTMRENKILTPYIAIIVTIILVLAIIEARR